MNKMDLSITTLHNAYQEGSLTPAAVVDYVLTKSSEYQQHNIWITLLSHEQIAPYLDRLHGHSPASLPLYGIPFALKDNIDLAGIPTTAACPEYSYVPEQSAFVVEQLIAAGAIPIGKTNMDQFATGLSGTRSPYGAVKNAINADYISGGSSSGSSVATALGLVSFALGTDTAGSGRVPAMFNNLIGVKPSCGLISSRGVIPACRSIDSVSLFALNPEDAAIIYPVITVYDQDDSFATQPVWPPIHENQTFTFGVIPRDQLQVFGNNQVYALMEAAIEQLKLAGGQPVEIDFTPFQLAATLLYEGPWVAERYAAIESILISKPEAIFPVTLSVISNAEKYNAVDTFQAIYRLRELKLQADRELANVDVVLTPTAADIYTIAAMNNDPIQLNSQLGYYTNFMNLLDYAAISIPSGSFTNGMPFGITLYAGKYSDWSLIHFAQRILTISGLSMGATAFAWHASNHSTAVQSTESEKDRIKLLVCGAHLTGMPLNHQLTDLDAVLLEPTNTSASYRLYCLPGGPPYRPALVRDKDTGVCIDVEVWSIPVKNLGRFLLGIPAPLGLGKVQLVDGSEVIGFICEPYVVHQSEDISEFSGWKNYLGSKNKNRT